jgi:hypothetical protein
MIRTRYEAAHRRETASSTTVGTRPLLALAISYVLPILLLPGALLVMDRRDHVGGDPRRQCGWDARRGTPCSAPVTPSQNRGQSKTSSS